MNIPPRSFLRKVCLILLCLLFANSCTNKTKCTVPPESDINASLPSATPNLSTDVFFDATSSMQGFVSEGSLSFYQQTIPMLERAVIKNGGQINFFKFGTEIKELPGRSYGDADKKDFYNDGSINKKTLIEKVIDRADPAHLTVIVSDLFQEKSDINQLSEKIKAKFIAQDLAVGILAIKSQFNGRIFDVGINNYSFAYNSRTETATYRPFFMLALGRHSDVQRYFDTLSAGEMSGFPDRHQLIYSRFLTSKISSLADSKVIDSDGVNEVNGVLVESPGRGALPYKEYKLKKNVGEWPLILQIPIEPLPNTAIYDQFHTEIEAFTCASDNKNAGDQNSAASLTRNAEASSAITISPVLSSRETMTVNVKIDAAKLDPKSVNAYRVIIRPANYSLPSWINEWNMSGDEVEKWRQSPEAFDGSKTYNLAPFLNTLWETNRQVHNPKLADFYFYFRIG